MTTTAIRKRLRDYIDTADDKQIKSIYALLEERIEPKVNWWEDKEFVADLDERVRRYEQGIDPSYTMEEVRARMQEMKSANANELGQ